MNRINKLPGTSLKNRCTITSLGIEGLDTLLDGGAPNSSFIVIDELRTTKFSLPICQCYIAEALEEGQHLFTAAPHQREINMLFEGVPTKYKKSNNSHNVIKQQNMDEKLKIAWRYSTVPEIDSNIAQQQCPKYDLSQKRYINMEELCKKNCYFNYEYSSIPEYSTLWHQLYGKLNSIEYSQTNAKNLLRILIMDIGSPLWSDPENLPRFIASLRALSRYSNCVITITMDSTILENAIYKNFIRHADAVFQLEIVEEETKKAMSLHQKFDGRFYVQKLPTVSSASTYRPDCLDLIFVLKRKTFEIKIFHLPPAIGADEENNLKKNTCQRIQDDF